MGLKIVGVALSPSGLIAWLVVGLIAGWATGLIMKRSGYGVPGNLVVGMVGSLLGGITFGTFVPGVAGFWGSIVVAFIGGCVLTFVMRAVGWRQEAWRP